VIIGLFDAFQGISERKATGFGAITGSLAEAYAAFGLIMAFVLPIAAITLLGKSFSRRDWMRSVLSLLSICGGALTLGLAGLFLRLSFRT
jgi:biopolymer transport protein ExbB/TolQ